MTGWLDTAWAWELRINGADVWGFLLSRTLRCTMYEGGAIGTLSFELEDTSNALEITEWSEVVLYPEPGKPIWGGYATVVKPDLAPGENHRRWSVRCESYETLLNHGNEVRKVWLDKTPGYILEDILTMAGISDFDTSLISSGTALDSFAANGEKLIEIITNLANRAGFVWSIEPDKGFVFGLPGDMVSSPIQITPFSSANFTSSFPPLSIGIQRDTSDVANYITVRGATMPSSPFNDVFVTDGVAERWLLTKRPVYDVIEVIFDGVDQAFGIDGFDDPGLYPWLVNLTLGYIRSTTGAPTAGKNLEVTYRYDDVITGGAYSGASYTYFNNRWFYLTVHDPTIITVESAEDLAEAILAEKEYGSLEITAEIDRVGVLPGQKWLPNFGVLGLDGLISYTVRQVTIEIDKETAFVRGTVKAGGKSPRLKAILENVSNQSVSSSIEYGVRSRKDWKAEAVIGDHGGLGGLSDDDHTQYLLATGTRTGASSQAQTFTNGIIGPTWKPVADSTTALQIQNAAGAAKVTIDTSNGMVGIGRTPGAPLDVEGPATIRLPAVGATSYFVITSATASAFNTRLGTTYGNQYAWFTNLYYAGGWQKDDATRGGWKMAQVVSTSDYLCLWNLEYAPVGSASAIQVVQAVGTATGANFIVRIGNLGVRTSAPLTPLHANLQDTDTAGVAAIATISHDLSSGTAAKGFGADLAFRLRTTTTANQIAARIVALWDTASDSSRAADLILYASDYAAEREGMRISANGSAAEIGFFGVNPVTRPSAYTVSNGTTDRAFDANATTLDELADVLGTLIGDLQGLGLVS